MEPAKTPSLKDLLKCVLFGIAVPTLVIGLLLLGYGVYQFSTDQKVTVAKSCTATDVFHFFDNGSSGVFLVPDKGKKVVLYLNPDKVALPDATFDNGEKLPSFYNMPKPIATESDTRIVVTATVPEGARLRSLTANCDHDATHISNLTISVRTGWSIFSKFGFTSISF